MRTRDHTSDRIVILFRPSSFKLQASACTSDQSITAKYCESEDAGDPLQVRLALPTSKPRGLTTHKSRQLSVSLTVQYSVFQNEKLPPFARRRARDWNFFFWGYVTVLGPNARQRYGS
jgi:hypothetical protein